MDIRMPQSQSAIPKKDAAKIKQLVAGYNMIPNVIWSVLNLTPISVFCYYHLNPGLVYAFIIISVLALFLPISFSGESN